jgi:hypothetical protein
VRDGRVERVDAHVTEGIGMRVRANGAWGFAATAEVSRQGAQEALGRALARALPRNGDAPLAPLDAPARGHWASPCERDPFAVSLEDKLCCWSSWACWGSTGWPTPRGAARCAAALALAWAPPRSTCPTRRAWRAPSRGPSTPKACPRPPSAHPGRRRPPRRPRHREAPHEPPEANSPSPRCGAWYAPVGEY